MGKYEFDSHLQISPDKRQELNEKILYLISSRLADSSGITPTFLTVIPEMAVYTG